jgi:hypothetical protein
VGRDGAVRGWISNAGKDEALAHLVVVKEGLVALINGAGIDLASARGASTSTARVWEIDT